MPGQSLTQSSVDALGSTGAVVVIFIGAFLFRHDVLTCPSSTIVGYVEDGKNLQTQSHLEEGRS